MRLLILLLITVHVQAACVDNASDCPPHINYISTIDHSSADAEFSMPCEQLQRDQYDGPEDWEYAMSTCDDSEVNFDSE